MKLTKIVGSTTALVIALAALISVPSADAANGELVVDRGSFDEFEIRCNGKG